MVLKFKQIAWNGIQFSIPITWELGWVDSNHLTFHKNSIPAMEIKWGPIKGRFSHHSQLKAITKGQKTHSGKKIIKWQLPPTWQQALATYYSQGFCWQRDANSGHGATLYCPVCKNAIILQLFDMRNRLTDPGVLQFLQTLSDHREDGCTTWQLFEIQAKLPRSLRLNHYHFKPGNHELALSNRFMTLRLYRWAPASALLSNTSLAAFVADTLGRNIEQLQQTSQHGYPAVEWHNHEKSGWLGRLQRFSIRPAFTWLFVWHLEAHNRIMGINLESKKPLEPNQMAQISDNFQLNLS